MLERTKTSKLAFEVGAVTLAIQEKLTWHSIPPLPPWNECRIWVIGASTGIGAATAQAVARRRRARRTFGAQGRRCSRWSAEAIRAR